jgi:hypothetical protein
MPQADDTPIPIQAAFRQVRDKDHAILTCIKDGDTTVRAINRATTLTRHQVNYAFRKLVDLDLITVRRPDGWTRSRLENGEYRTHRKSKEAQLTARGKQYFAYVDGDEDLGRFDAEHKRSLEEEVAALREDVNALQEELRKHKQALQQLHYGNQSRSKR